MKDAIIAHLSQFGNWRRTLLLVAGTIVAGISVGLIIASDLGAAPMDAAVVNIAESVPLSVGTISILISVAMVLIAWAIGAHPKLGILIVFFGIGVLIDVTLNVVNATDLLDTFAARIVAWVTGTVLLSAAAAALMSSGLGASAYDHFVLSLTRYKLSLPRARLVVDGCMLVVALLLGGAAIGLGTIGLFLLIPLCLKLLYPPIHAFANR